MALGSVATFRTYVLLSLVLSTAVVGHAAYQKRFFYRTMVYLGDSKIAILAAGNLCLVSVILVWKLVQRIFLGRLRFREIERLNTRARDAIIECCFATTIFREEVNLTFLTLVTTLLMLKSLHWLAKDRMDFLEEQPLSPRVAHVRLVGLMALLFTADTYLVSECAKTTFQTKGGTMLVLFAFEFTVLLIELFSDFVRYVFHAIDLRMDGRWEAKGLYVFYNELVTDLCQLTVYLAFFLYVHTFYTFPLHILREVYLTFAKFQRRCSDFIRYRRVVSTMNDLFPDATEEELAEGDRTCIICREEMPAAKKLACGHMFHARCLQSWLRRQLSCPTCRSNVDVNPPSQPRVAPAPGAPPANAPPAAGAPGDAAPAGNAPQPGAVPPPPDDAENPGFLAHAQRLWRHIAYGAPRDGGAPPAPEPVPQPGPAPPLNLNPRAAPGAAPRGIQWPQIRFGVRFQAGRGPMPLPRRQAQVRQHAEHAQHAQHAQHLPHPPHQPQQQHAHYQPPRAQQPQQRAMGFNPPHGPLYQLPAQYAYAPQQQAWSNAVQHARRAQRMQRAVPRAQRHDADVPQLQQMLNMQEEIDRIYAQVDVLRNHMHSLIDSAVDAADAGADANTNGTAALGAEPGPPSPTLSHALPDQSGPSLPPTHTVEPVVPALDEVTLSAGASAAEEEVSPVEKAPVSDAPPGPEENSEQATLRQHRLRFLDGKKGGPSGKSGSAK